MSTIVVKKEEKLKKIYLNEYCLNDYLNLKIIL